jgi:hypothetical protein
MPKQLEGVIVCAKVEKFDTFLWTDQANGQVKPIRSLKILLSHGDGTVTRESISVPTSMADPNLKDGQIYALPCTITMNKKKLTLSWTLRSDMAPFPAPELG